MIEEEEGKSLRFKYLETDRRTLGKLHYEEEEE